MCIVNAILSTLYINILYFSLTLHGLCTAFQSSHCTLPWCLLDLAPCVSSGKGSWCGRFIPIFTRTLCPSAMGVTQDTYVRHHTTASSCVAYTASLKLETFSVCCLGGGGKENADAVQLQVAYRLEHSSSWVAGKLCTRQKRCCFEGTLLVICVNACFHVPVLFTSWCLMSSPEPLKHVGLLASWHSIPWHGCCAFPFFTLLLSPNQLRLPHTFYVAFDGFGVRLSSLVLADGVRECQW